MHRRSLLAGVGIGLSMPLTGCSGVLRTDAPGHRPRPRLRSYLLELRPRSGGGDARVGSFLKTAPSEEPTTASSSTASKLIRESSTDRIRRAFATHIGATGPPIRFVSQIVLPGRTHRHQRQLRPGLTTSCLLKSGADDDVGSWPQWGQPDASTRNWTVRR